MLLFWISNQQKILMTNARAFNYCALTVSSIKPAAVLKLSSLHNNTLTVTQKQTKQHQQKSDWKVKTEPHFPKACITLQSFTYQESETAPSWKWQLGHVLTSAVPSISASLRRYQPESETDLAAVVWVCVFSDGVLPCPVSWFIWGQSHTSTGLKFKEMIRNIYGQWIMKTSKQH